MGCLRRLPLLPVWAGVALGCAVALDLLINSILGDTLNGLLKLQLHTGTGNFEAVMREWSPQDFERFHAHLIADTLFAFAYSGALALAMSWGFRGSDAPGWCDFLLLLPSAACVFDLAETQLCAYEVNCWESLHRVNGVAVVASVAAIVKFAALALSCVATGVALVAAAVRALSGGGPTAQEPKE